jgi:hypothetical protein
MVNTHFFFLIIYLFMTYGAHSQCPVRICAMVLVSRFEARSKKDFFGAGGVIDSFPLSILDVFFLMYGGIP